MRLRHGGPAEVPGQLPSLSRLPPGPAAGVTQAAVTHRARDRAAACRSGPVLLGVTRRHGNSDRDCGGPGLALLGSGSVTVEAAT
jgi:hypothetical protein